MLLAQLDMPTARYAFAFLATGEKCQKREGFISYRIGAKRQYIELELVLLAHEQHHFALALRHVV
jgi:hypothetical protein